MLITFPEGPVPWMSLLHSSIFSLACLLLITGLMMHLGP